MSVHRRRSISDGCNSHVYIRCTTRFRLEYASVCQPVSSKAASTMLHASSWCRHPRAGDVDELHVRAGLYLALSACKLTNRAAVWRRHSCMAYEMRMLHTAVPCLIASCLILHVRLMPSSLVRRSDSGSCQSTTLSIYRDR
jgi:hypothetical protein